MLFDTHAHLNDEAFDDDRDELLEEIRTSDVGYFVNIGTNVKTSLESIELANKYDFIYSAVGIHPHDVIDAKEEDIDKLMEMSKNPKVVAIGEIGLDYYYDFSPRDMQREWFIKQIKLSKELNLPFVIHSRDASKDTYNILEEYAEGSKFVLHCYSQSAEMVERYVKLGAYISFAGSLTFKNAKNLQEAVKRVPLDKLLIETDSPYLTPVPFRGKRNNPMRVKEVAKFTSEILDIDYDKICEITFKNGTNFYSIEK